jgi:SulP family sulfate permease
MLVSTPGYLVIYGALLTHRLRLGVSDGRWEQLTSPSRLPQQSGYVMTEERRDDETRDERTGATALEPRNHQEEHRPLASDVSHSGHQQPAPRPRFGTPKGWFAHVKDDALAAVTSAVANIPDGMASGVLAGINPVYGLYTLMIGLPVSAILTSTHAMVFNTTSAMTLVAAAGLGSRSGDDRAQAVFVIALVAGVFQTVLGILGLGQLTRFVSNAVMRGFLTGIAVLIILGQLWDLTGYSGESGLTKLQQTSDLIAHLDEIDAATSIIGLGSLGLMYALLRTRLASFNLLVALAIATIAAQLSWFDDISLVESLGEIPSSLPTFDLPALGQVPALALTGIAVGVVGLLQSAGVAQSFPNPNSSDPDDSRDFLAQGVANITSSMFQGMPGGGSLSGTALNVAAGARTRLSMIIQALVVVIIILAFSTVLSLIPMASLAALLIYSATLAIKPGAIVTVVSTTIASAFILLVTFFATLIVPLQQAVVIGIILAAIIYIYRASTEVRVVQLRVANDGVVEEPPAATLPSHAVTVLDTYGSLFYAGTRSLSRQLPSVGDAERAVVVLRIRGHADLGSTFLSMIGRYAEQLRDHGGQLLLSGVDPVVKTRMARTGHLRIVGEENVFLADHVIGKSSRAALEAGQRWIAAQDGAT